MIFLKISTSVNRQMTVCTNATTRLVTTPATVTTYLWLIQTTARAAYVSVNIQSTVSKKMATGSFTHNSLRTKP